MRIKCRCENVCVHVVNLEDDKEATAWLQKLQVDVEQARRAQIGMGVVVQYEELVQHTPAMFSDGTPHQLLRCVNCAMFCLARAVSSEWAFVNEAMKEAPSQNQGYSNAFKIVLPHMPKHTVLRHENPRRPALSGGASAEVVARVTKREREYLNHEETQMKARIEKFIADQHRQLQEVKGRTQLERMRLLTLIAQASHSLPDHRPSGPAVVDEDADGVLVPRLPSSLPSISLGSHLPSAPLTPLAAHTNIANPSVVTPSLQLEPSEGEGEGKEEAQQGGEGEGKEGADAQKPEGEKEGAASNRGEKKKEEKGVVAGAEFVRAHASSAGNRPMLAQSVPAGAHLAHHVDDGEFARPALPASSRPRIRSVFVRNSALEGIFAMDDEHEGLEPSGHESESEEEDEEDEEDEEEEMEAEAKKQLKPIPNPSILSTSAPIGIPDNQALVYKRLERPRAESDERQMEPLMPPHTLAAASGFDAENYPINSFRSRKLSVL